MKCFAEILTSIKIQIEKILGRDFDEKLKPEESFERFTKHHKEF